MSDSQRPNSHVLDELFIYLFLVLVSSSLKDLVLIVQVHVPMFEIVIQTLQCIMVENIVVRSGKQVTMTWPDHLPEFALWSLEMKVQSSVKSAKRLSGVLLLPERRSWFLCLGKCSHRPSFTLDTACGLVQHHPLQTFNFPVLICLILSHGLPYHFTVVDVHFAAYSKLSAFAKLWPPICSLGITY